MNEDIRETARKRITSKRDFWKMLIGFAVLAIVFNIIWLISGYQSYYWPAWPMIGFAIATVFSAINTFGSGRQDRVISDQDIDREIGKMNGGA